MFTLECHFTGGLIRVMGGNPTVGRETNTGDRHKLNVTYTPRDLNSHKISNENLPE